MLIQGSTSLVLDRGGGWVIVMTDNPSRTLLSTELPASARENCWSSDTIIGTKRIPSGECGQGSPAKCGQTHATGARETGRGATVELRYAKYRLLVPGSDRRVYGCRPVNASV